MPRRSGPGRPPARPGSHALRVFLAVFGVCCWAPLAWAAEPAASPAQPAQDISLPAPFSFAPSPFVFPDHKASVEKRLQTLIKSFRFVQQAKVILSPTSAGQFQAYIIMQTRRSEPLSQEALHTLTAALAEATPELPPQGLNILTPQGQFLVRQGQIQEYAAPPVPRPAPWPWASGILLGGGGLGLWGFLWWRRKNKAQRALLDIVIWDYRYRLIQELRQERPEVCGVLIAAASPRAARWLKRECQKAQVPYVLPQKPVTPAIVALITEALYERLSNLPGRS